VMVLGMRCSGTYLCSHVLSALGLDVTDNMRLLITTDRVPDNTRSGHWERWGNHRVPRPHLAVLQPRVFQPLQRLRVTGRVVGGSARTARDHRFLRPDGQRLFRVQGPAHLPADADVPSDHQRVEARPRIVFCTERSRSKIDGSSARYGAERNGRRTAVRAAPRSTPWQSTNGPRSLILASVAWKGDDHTGAVWRGWRRLNHSFRTTGSALPRPKPAGRVSSHPRAPN
jgi:hypothetical protein